MAQFKEVGEYSPGQQLKVDEIFKVGDMVDVAGKSIGKGFQGNLTLSAV
jgi:large subunit ribosomal protein L3